MTNTTTNIFGLFVDTVANTRPSEAARRCAEELEELDVQQIDNPDERQPWTPAYKERVAQIIDRHMGARR